MSEIPQHVIRFYGKTDYALECIALKQITFIHTEKLNDPFDPALEFYTDFNDDYAVLLSHIKEHHADQLEFFRKRLPEESWNKIVAGWSGLSNTFRTGMFVFSTCAVLEDKHPRDSLYMWSHYGNGHRGVAIEFNSTALAKSITENNDGWWKMDYMKELPPITCEDIFEYVTGPAPDINDSNSKLASAIQKRLHSKSEVWQHENEWRLAWNNDETKMKILRRNLLNGAIAAVYLGCRIPETVRDNLAYETQRNFPNASVFQAKMRRGKYAVDFEKII